jgi:long-chain acyl-CoA synthetase
MSRGAFVTIRFNMEHRVESVVEYLNTLGHASKSVALRSYESCVSYAELFSESYKLAECFLAGGVRAGEILAVVVPSTPEFVVVQLACSAAGVVFFPIDPSLPKGELSVWLDRAKPHHLFMVGSAGRSLDALQQSHCGSYLEEIAAGLHASHQVTSKRFLPLPLHTNTSLLITFARLAVTLPTALSNGGFLRFSSGTTGNAKGVCISQERAIERARVMNGLRFPEENVCGAIDSDDVVLCALPLPYHFVVSVLWFLQQGATIQFPPGTGFAVAEATVAYASPVQVRRLMAEQSLTKNLRKVFCTSMPLSGALGSEFYTQVGIPVTQLLGNIEVGIVMANTDAGIQQSHLLGQRLPAFEIEVRNEAGVCLEPGGIGELFVRGPGAANCYLDPFVPVANEGSNGWISTGDMVRVDSAGNYEHCGRSVSAINVAGHKVFAEEVEKELCADPGIRAARVFGEPHDIYGTRLVAEVVMQSGHSLNERAVRSRLRSCLAAYKIPSEYICRSELPLTPTGKVKRPEVSIVGEQHDL